MKDFQNALASQSWPELDVLKSEVTTFAQSFPTIGFEESSMKF
jgi:hypothetical protein